MTPAERAALMGLAEDFAGRECMASERCADELRAKIAELDKEGGDG